MQIQFGSTILVAGGIDGVVGLRLNGDSLIDEATFFRALVASFYSRGNKTTDFEFSKRWQFNTRGGAENFIMGHWASLAQKDILTVTCGDGESVEYVYQMPLAILKSVTLEEWIGVEVKMHYVFVGGLFTTDTVIPPDEDNLIKRGTVVLSPGDTTKTVAFGSSFAGTPVVLARVNRPSSASDTVVDWDAPEADVTSGGFIAAGQAIPASGYTLNWIAITP